MKDKIAECNTSFSGKKLSWLKKRHAGIVASGVVVLALIVACCEAAGFGHFSENLAAQIPSSVENKSAGDAPADFSKVTDYLDADTEQVVSSLEDAGFDWDDDTMAFGDDDYHDDVMDEQALCEMQFSAFPGRMSASLIQTREQLLRGTVIPGMWMHMHFSDNVSFQGYDAQAAISAASKYGLDNALSATDSAVAPLWLKSANTGKQSKSSDAEVHDTPLKGTNAYTRLDYGLACGTIQQNGYDYAWVCTCYQDDSNADANVELMIMSGHNFETYYGVSAEDPVAAEYVAAAYLFGTHVSVDFGLNR